MATDRSIAIIFAAFVFLGSGCTGLMTEEHAGEITDNRVWSGLHRITDDLVVDGAELRVECGTHVAVEPGVTVRVGAGGRALVRGCSTAGGGCLS